MLTKHLKPTYSYTAGDNGGSRQSISGTSWQAVGGASKSYTSGPTAEVLYIQGSCLLSPTASGSLAGILVNGSPVSRTDYGDSYANGAYSTRRAETLYEIPANTTATIALGVKLSSGTGTIANQSADVANDYTPELIILAFGKS